MSLRSRDRPTFSDSMMKHLTLIRHAKSSWADSNRTDFDRPLNQRGKKTAPRMGELLSHQYLDNGELPPPDAILASPARRALTTAQLLTPELGIPAEEIRQESRIYEASVATLLQVIREFDDEAAHVMLVGHNPGFENLAHTLDPGFEGDGEKFPTCGVAMMTLDLDSWSDIEKNCVRDTEFIDPKMIDA